MLFYLLIVYFYIYTCSAKMLLQPYSKVPLVTRVLRCLYMYVAHTCIIAVPSVPTEDMHLQLEVKYGNTHLSCFQIELWCGH